MRIAVVHNEVSLLDDNESTSDVLVQCQQVTEALTRLGHVVRQLACSCDLVTMRRSLEAFQPEVVFNLVESLGGTDRMMPAFTLLLESMGIPFTGSGSYALLVSGDKLRAKRLFWQAGISTALWFDANAERWCGAAASVTPKKIPAPERFIIKSVHEHASCGIEDHSVMDWLSDEQVQFELERFESRHSLSAMAEAFVGNREFNLSLLEMNGSVHVLPPAEIDFSGLPAGKPKIVGYAAKWSTESIEYLGTPRKFHFAASESQLLQSLACVAKDCFSLLELSGYARVDFRVAADDRPIVLEVNANPCLSADAGFAAALSQAGISFDEAINQLVARAIASKSRMPTCF